MSEALTGGGRSRVFELELGRSCRAVVRGEGVWVEDSDGRRYLDAMSGGSTAATLGHGRRDIVAAARAQAERLAYVHTERLTNPLQERLAEKFVAVAPEGLTRARFATSGSDANEMAIQLARAYHVERGEPQRWQVISPARGIRCNALCPGPIETPLLTELLSEEAARRRRFVYIPMGRLGSRPRTT